MHLRRLRQAQSLTLRALAEQVGVTASALSQIERGTSEPSLGTLWRLGRALNASLFDFFAGQEAPTVDVTRAGDRTVVEFERFRYEVMARSAQRGIDLFTLRLEPGDGPGARPDRPRRRGGGHRRRGHDGRRRRRRDVPARARRRDLVRQRRSRTRSRRSATSRA